MNAPAIDYASGIADALEAMDVDVLGVTSHALRAGELLAKAKAALRHGDFGDFCAMVPLSATTARAYMRLAALAPEERQRVADLPLRTALQKIAHPHSRRWAPTRHYRYDCVVGDATFYVIPDSNCLSRFHVSMLKGGEYVGAWFSVPDSMVERRLRFLGLNDPFSAPWSQAPSDGLPRPFGSQ